MEKIFERKQAGRRCAVRSPVRAGSSTPKGAKDFLKEIKIEKYEKNEKHEFEPVFDPGDMIPDPRYEQVIQAVEGLTKQASPFADQVEERSKRVGDR